MAILVDEKRMLEENMFDFEERVKSPLNRFSNKTYTAVEYYHINNIETTTDPGYGDVENMLGERSPVRFQVIHDFPIYGLETINLDLNDGDFGLDSSYSSEGTILPGTIIPLQNDYFIIKQLNDKFVFRITEVQNDSVMPENFYKISFQLEYNDSSMQEALENQTTEKYNCVMENIGTDNQCIIEDKYHEELRKINKMYRDIVEVYTTLFYNKRYNCLLGDLDPYTKIYDPFQTEFIRKHQLFVEKNKLDSLLLNQQFEDRKRQLKYERSIYRFIETKNFDRLTKFPYCTFLGLNNKTTAFFHWHDKNVKILDIEPNMGQDALTLLSDDSYSIIDNNYPTDSKYLSLISNYVRKDNLKPADIDLSLGDDILSALDANLEIFFFTPIILYIIKDITGSFIKRKHDE